MNHGTLLLIELGAVLLGLGLLSRFARRIHLSPIPFYLIVGLALGQGRVVPLVTADEFISLGAEIGVILMLFMLGLEYSAVELVGNLRGAAPAGALDAALNALPGAMMALMLGWGPVAATALAGITWVSSSGVIAKVLGDLRRIGNRETPTVLSILVIEDLAMAVYLPLLVTLLAGSDWVTGGASLLVAVVAVGFVLLVAVRYGHLVSRVVASEDNEGLLLGVLGLTLVVSGLAASLQVSAAIGAFLVGIAISGPVVANVAPLLAPLRDLFAAVFFVFFGLATDPSAMPPVLLPALLLAVVTMTTKTITGYLSARRAGIARLGRWRAGLTLVPRGEFSIVIAGLAVAAGTEPALAPLSTAYVLITVVAGPMLARLPDLTWFKSMIAPRPAVAAHTAPTGRPSGPGSSTSAGARASRVSSERSQPGPTPPGRPPHPGSAGLTADPGSRSGAADPESRSGAADPPPPADPPGGRGLPGRIRAKVFRRAAGR